MPRYDYLCEHGDTIEITDAANWQDAETNYTCPEGGRLIGFASSSAPSLKYFSVEQFRVKGLKKRKDFSGQGSEVYTSERELQQEMKEQGKIWNEAGLDAECDRNRAEREAKNSQKISAKLEKFVHQMTPYDVDGLTKLRPATGDAVPTVKPGIRLSERSEID